MPFGRPACLLHASLKPKVASCPWLHSGRQHDPAFSNASSRTSHYCWHCYEQGHAFYNFEAKDKKQKCMLNPSPSRPKSIRSHHSDNDHNLNQRHTIDWHSARPVPQFCNFTFGLITKPVLQGGCTCAGPYVDRLVIGAFAVRAGLRGQAHSGCQRTVVADAC